eukprot:COSAG02_NODE_42027_length_388_cov_1.211073_1_plen_69_part_10
MSIVHLLDLLYVLNSTCVPPVLCTTTRARAGSAGGATAWHWRCGRWAGQVFAGEGSVGARGRIDAAAGR